MEHTWVSLKSKTTPNARANELNSEFFSEDVSHPKRLNRVVDYERSVSLQAEFLNNKIVVKVTRPMQFED